MKVYEQIQDMLCDELEEIAKKKELTTNSLEVLYKSMDILKDISTINAMEQEYGGYSQDGYSQGRYSQEGSSRDGYSGGYYGRMPFYMYDDGMSQDSSYARGRGRNAKRDSMGRYSREGRSYDGYSGDTKEELKRLMDTAQNDREREAIRSALDQMGR